MSTIVLLYNKYALCISCHFRPLKSLTLRMDHAKLLDVLTSFPVSHAISPHAVRFATSRPANHAICILLTRVDMHLGQSFYIYLFIYRLYNK